MSHRGYLRISRLRNNDGMVLSTRSKKFHLPGLDDNHRKEITKEYITIILDHSFARFRLIKIHPVRTHWYFTKKLHGRLILYS